MFKIEQLTMFHPDGREHIYEFKEGLNYYQGNNDVGKTQFLEFIDFMFGRSLKIQEKDWYKSDLEYATLTFFYRGQQYKLTRTLDLDKNYFIMLGQQEEQLNADRYKARLNAIFSMDPNVLEELKLFTDEGLTYRTYSLFNFLEERNQGRNYNFFTKLSERKYMFKMPTLLNYIFNPHKEQIRQLINEINNDSIELRELEEKRTSTTFVKDKINKLLQRLNIHILYKGNNQEEVIEELNKLNKFGAPKEKKSIYEKDLLRLKLKYNEIEEQLKNYKSISLDLKGYVFDNNKRIGIFNELKEMLTLKKEMSYLIDPLLQVLEESKETITLSNNLGITDTIKKLRKELEKIRKEIHEKSSTLIRFKLTEKEQAVATIQEYIKENADIDESKIDELEKELKRKKDLLKELKREEDKEKVTELSKTITKYYLAAADSVEVEVVVARHDKAQKGFHIRYFKNSDTLQPRVTKVDDRNNIVKEEGEGVIIDYYPGSMARHTLIQLAGYLGFLRILIEEKKHPLMPFLVIDHISQTFDKDNKRGIGKVIEAFYQDISKSDFQIIMLDQDQSTNLSVKADKETSLVTKNITGFNPFYKKT